MNRPPDYALTDLHRRDPVVLSDLVTTVAGLALRPGWRSNDEALPERGPSYWHFNFSPDLPSGPDLPPPPGRQGGRSTVRLPRGRPPRSVRVFAQVWDLVQATLGLPQLGLRRCYVNAYLFGSDTLVHRDSPHPDEVTCIVPAHHTWDPDWGGATILYPNGVDQGGIEILPEPGRALLFRSAYLHHAAPLSRDCPMLRRVLVFKFGGVAPEATLATLIRQSAARPREPDCTPSLGAALLWLAAAGLDTMPGPSGTLTGYLASSAFWARSVGGSADATLAALCHGLCGSLEGLPPAMDPTTDRALLGRVFGERATAIGLGFAALPPAVLHGAASAVTAHTTTGDPPPAVVSTALASVRAAAPPWLAPWLDDPEILMDLWTLQVATRLASTQYASVGESLSAIERVTA